MSEDPVPCLITHTMYMYVEFNSLLAVNIDLFVATKTGVADDKYTIYIHIIQKSKYMIITLQQ
jgi:uncharacterized membrane protein YwzB